jgi:hypothetical protein
VVEPRFGKLPVPPDRSRRTLQYLGGLLLAHAPEIAQFHHLGLARRDAGEGGERIVQRQDEYIGSGEMMGASQFFAISAQIVRNILVDAARARGAHKRGGEAVKINVEQFGVHQRGQALERGPVAAAPSL